MEKTRIIIADDHQLFRNGLKMLLESIPEFEIAGEASNGEEFLQVLKNSPADIALMDINMPEMDGIEATRKGLKIDPWSVSAQIPADAPPENGSCIG